MKVLFLGPSVSPLLDYLRSVEDEVLNTTDPIHLDFLNANSPDFIVSYGYRHILKKDVLTRFSDRAVNLHISYLPWNRGADPNFWSFVEDTPKGVTIHYLDERVDTGDIIVQKEVPVFAGDTLRSNYNKLQEEIRRLFIENWGDIRACRCPRRSQDRGGTFHRVKDREALAHLLPDGWDTPVSVLEDLIVKNREAIWNRKSEGRP